MSDDMQDNSESQKPNSMMSELRSDYSGWHLEAERQARRRARFQIVKDVFLCLGAAIGLVFLLMGLLSFVFSVNGGRL